MGKRVITVNLSPSGIDCAVQELQAYRAEFLRKAEAYRQRVAAEMAVVAQSYFDTSAVDDAVKGGPRSAEVTVSVDERGGVSVIVAQGEDTVFCEFGAGVYHNGAAGSSPHPKGAELELTIGSYGKGQGRQTAWGYYGADGELVITRGTPATMPLYTASREVARRAVQIAKEVFV